MAKKKIVVVGTQKGGVGKTYCSIALVDMMRAAGVLQAAPDEVKTRKAFGKLLERLAKASAEVLPVDVDVDPGAERGKSSLSRHIADAVPYAILPSDDEITADPRILMAHFDRLYQMTMKAENSIIDLGANVISRFWDWADNSEVASEWAIREVELNFVAVTTADETAFGMAADALERIVEICKPHGLSLKLFLVLNHVNNGQFARYANSDSWKRLLQLGTSHGLKTILVKECIHDLTEQVDMLGKPPSQILRLTSKEALSVLPNLPAEWEEDVVALKFKRSVNEIIKWYGQFLTQALVSGLLGDGTFKVKKDDEWIV